MIREARIAARVRGRKVLDVGSLGQSERYRLWHVLDAEAASLTGIDLPDEALAKLPRVGSAPEPTAAAPAAPDPRIVRGDMEHHDFGERFDVIVAGDVIEHASNPGRLLDNCRRHLVEEGELVLTTPNAKWPTVFLVPNPTHTHWHDRHTLRHLLERHGFRVVSIETYPGNKPHYPWPLRLLAWQQALLVVATPAR